MSAIYWINRQARVWWPLIASVVAAFIIGTMVYVMTVVVEQRDHLRQEAARAKSQSEDLAVLVEAQRVAEESTDRRLDKALAHVEEVLLDHFARHDANVAEKLNETLHRIEVLLGRPAGTPPEPVVAQPAAPFVPPPRQEPTTAPTTTVRPVAPSAPRQPVTTTTTPDQKSCTKRPDGPRC